MEQTLPKTLKTFISKSGSSFKIKSSSIIHNYITNIIKLYIPKDLDIFKPDEELVVRRTLEGFLIRKATIDDRKTIKFNHKRFITLGSTNDIDDEYEYEIVDEDTLKLIRI
jgi:hypothetical protein